MQHSSYQDLYLHLLWKTPQEINFIYFDNKEISGIFDMLHNPCFIFHKGADYFIILSSFYFQIICFV